MKITDTRVDLNRPAEVSFGGLCIPSFPRYLAEQMVRFRAAAVRCEHAFSLLLGAGEIAGFEQPVALHDARGELAIECPRLR